MNRTKSQKYGYPSEAVEKKSLSDDISREIYDFHSIVSVSKVAARYKCYNIRVDKKIHVEENFTNRC